MDELDANQDRELLLAETAWLGRLAAELVPAADRDDLVQDVLLRAVHQGAAASRPRAWLATVARNRAAQLRQRARHRRAREQAVARPEASAPAAGEVVAGFALHRDVVNAVGELDEPYRAAVLLRFWEGLPPREVARRLGVPVETARTRIKRGVEQLRRRLDERAGGRRAWVAALLQIDAVADALAAGAGTTTISPLLLGALTMKNVALATAAAAIAVTLLFAWPSLRSAAGERTPLPPVALAEAPTPPAEAPPVDAAPTEVARTAAPVAATGSVQALVRYEDGSPAADVGVSMLAEGAPAATRELRTDATGRVSFAELAPGSFEVRIDRGGRQQVHVQPGVSADCAFVLARGVAVTGQVTTLDRQGVAAATVCAIQIDHPELLVALGTTADDGSFALRDVPPGTQLVARKTGWQPSRLRGSEVRGTPGSTAKVSLVLGARAFALRGRVLDPSGAPAPFARVLVAVDEDCRKRIDGLTEVRAGDGNGKLDREGFVLRADADGTFSSSEVPWGDVAVVARGAGALESSIGAAVATVRPGVTNEITVHLQRGAEVYGTVRDPAGVPYGGMTLMLDYDGSEAVGELDRDQLSNEVLDGRVQVAADGTFCFRGVYPATYDVNRELPGRSERLGKVEPLAGERHNLDLVLPRTWQLQIEVRDPSGQPLAGWAAMLSNDATIAYRRAAASVTGADGTRVASELLDDALWLTVHAPTPSTQEPWSRMPSFVQRVERGQPKVVAVVAPPQAGVHLRVLGSDGAPRAGASLELLLRDCGEKLRARTDAEGRATFADLPAGQFVLEASSNGPHLRRELALEPAQQLQLGDLLLPAAATLEVEVLVDGVAVRGTKARLLQPKPNSAPGNPDWTEVTTLKSRDGVLLADDLLEGSYLLQVRCPDCAPEVRTVDLRAGASTRLRIDCTKAIVQEFTIVLSDATVRARGHGYAWLTIVDGNGLPLLEEYASAAIPDASVPELTMRIALRPDTYTAKARGRTGTAEATIQVTTPPTKIRLVLQ